MTYILVKPLTVTIFEGLTSPQFQYLNPLCKVVCWLLSLVCWKSHCFPREGLVIGQMFPGLDFSHITKGVIKIERDTKGNLCYSRHGIELERSGPTKPRH